MQKTYSPDYHPFACLPFLHVSIDKPLHLGPIQIESFAKWQHRLNANQQKKYIECFTKLGFKNSSFETIACVSIDSHFPTKKSETLLIDALYTLFFVTAFKQSHTSNNVFSLTSYTTLLTLNEVSSSLSIEEKPELSQLIKIELLPSLTNDILQGLSQALNLMYSAPQTENLEEVQFAHRLIRAIRYFCDRFFNRFKNLFIKGISFDEVLFEPEDVLFLITSFETLFDLNLKAPGPDLKQKLRPLLLLKFSRPVEVFWSWVDGFYKLRDSVTHPNTPLERIFKENPSFEIPYVLLGVKLFIYSIFMLVSKLGVMAKHEENIEEFPKDFTDMHPENVLVFMWPEENLLRKISFLFLQWIYGSEVTSFESIKKEMELLCRIYEVILHLSHLPQNEHPSIKSMTLHPTIKSELMKELISLYQNPLFLEQSKKNGTPHLPPAFLILLRGH